MARFLKTGLQRLFKRKLSATAYIVYTTKAHKGKTFFVVRHFKTLDALTRPDVQSLPMIVRQSTDDAIPASSENPIILPTIFHYR